MYYILVSINTRKRTRRANCFVLTLSLYRSNFPNVVKALSLLTTLDRGIEVYIPRTGNVLLVAFTYAFIGDML